MSLRELVVSLRRAARSADGDISCHEIITALTKRFGGRGGGKPDLAQAGGKDPGKLNEAIDHAPQALREVLGG